MTWEDPDDAKQERYVRAMMENEQRALLLTSTIQLMGTILKTQPESSIDEARTVSLG